MFDLLLRPLRRLCSPSHQLEYRTFDDAVLSWKADKPAETITLNIKFKMARIATTGVAQAELRIDQEGIVAHAVVTVSPTATTVALGNYFWVPEQLQRRGLGSAIVVSLAWALQRAAFGDTASSPIYLEGIFIQEGARFANAICETQPENGSAAKVRDEVVRRVSRQIQQSS